LAGFRARFGRGFDAGREPISSTEAAGSSEGSSTKAAKMERVGNAGLEDNGFAEEEDANPLDLIKFVRGRRAVQEVTRKAVVKVKEALESLAYSRVLHVAERGVARGMIFVAWKLSVISAI
jgi:hypothetical protein